MTELYKNLTHFLQYLWNEKTVSLEIFRVGRFHCPQSSGVTKLVVMSFVAMVTPLNG